MPNDVLPDAPKWSQVRENPFFEGNLAPVTDEVELTNLEIVGDLPEGLEGTFMRVGPNTQFEPLGQYHVFDGDGMIHAVTIEGGKARYKNRWVLTRGLMYEREQGRACFYGPGSMRFPEPEVFARFGPSKNLANTNVVRHAGGFWALYEGGRPIEVTSSLSTVGEVPLEGLSSPFTAHPKIDPETDEMFAFGYSAFPPFLTYYAIDPQGQIYHKQPIFTDYPSMVHDFAVTDRHAVFIVGPGVIDLAEGARGGEVIRWRPELGTKLYVLPRDGGEVRALTMSTCFVFHFLNAFEQDGRLIVDAVRVQGLAANQGAGQGGDDDVPKGYLTRFTVDLDKGHVVERKLALTPTEFPRIDDRLTGRKHRYGYNVHYARRNFPGFYTHAHRLDIETGEEQLYAFGEGRTTGELCFVPNPKSAREEDGFLLSYVYDRKRNASELSILSAGDIRKGPIARVLVPRRIPEGFHVNWFGA